MRQFARYDAITGDALGPASEAETDPLIQALDDGSFLTGAGAGPIGWRGPDGTDRGTTSVALPDLRSADVDANGALLLLDRSGTVTRTAPASAPDLTLSAVCPPSNPPPGPAGPFAVGAAPDGGFAVACGGLSFPRRVTVTRFDATGVAHWQTVSGSPTENPTLLDPTHLTVTPDDAVWVGGSGAHTGIDPLGGKPAIVISRFTEAGVGDDLAGYLRQLRPLQRVPPHVRCAR